jgi:hypothetical protein
LAADYLDQLVAGQDLKGFGISGFASIEAGKIKSAMNERRVTEARRVVCYIAVRKLGYKCTEVLIPLAMPMSSRSMVSAKTIWSAGTRLSSLFSAVLGF